MSIWQDCQERREQMTELEKKEIDKYRLGDFIPFYIGQIVRNRRCADTDYISENALYGLYQRASVVLPVGITVGKLLADWLIG